MTSRYHLDPSSIVNDNYYYFENGNKMKNYLF